MKSEEQMFIRLACYILIIFRNRMLRRMIFLRDISVVFTCYRLRMLNVILIFITVFQPLVLIVPLTDLGGMIFKVHKARSLSLGFKHPIHRDFFNWFLRFEQTALSLQILLKVINTHIVHQELMHGIVLKSVSICYSFSD